MIVQTAFRVGLCQPSDRLISISLSNFDMNMRVLTTEIGKLHRTLEQNTRALELLTAVSETEDMKGSDNKSEVEDNEDEVEEVPPHPFHAPVDLCKINSSDEVGNKAIKRKLRAMMGLEAEVDERKSAEIEAAAHESD